MVSFQPKSILKEIADGEIRSENKSILTQLILETMSRFENEPFSQAYQKKIADLRKVLFSDTTAESNRDYSTLSKLRFDQKSHTPTWVGEMDQPLREQLKELINFFLPWKKGPFTIGDFNIDAEWRSDLKWERVLNQSGLNFSGKRIADIGCNNGYFMLSLLRENPKLVIGFEPVLKNYLCFDFLQSIDPSACQNLSFQPLGVEHIHHFEGFFDQILCMGIIYHQTDPIQMLRNCRIALRNRGELILESHSLPPQVCSSESRSICLVPENRYAGASGVWWVPSQDCLLNWIKRAGFSHSKIFYSAPLTSEEQRTTACAPIKSLRDFLNPDDREKTIEGHPAPWRTYVVARR